MHSQYVIVYTVTKASPSYIHLYSKSKFQEDLNNSKINTSQSLLYKTHLIHCTFVYAIVRCINGGVDILRVVSLRSPKSLEGRDAGKFKDGRLKHVRALSTRLFRMLTSTWMLAAVH